MKKMNFTFIDISCWLKTLAMLLAFGLAGAGQVYAQPPQLMVQDASGQEPSGPISRTLPEGACSYQFQWTVFVFDPAGPATANAYITTSTSSTSVNPDASLVLLGSGQSYVLDVIAAVGTNTLTVRKDGPSGSVTQTFTIVVDDVRAPQIYGPGNMAIEVPSCDTDGVPVNWTVSTVDDCDLAPALSQTAGPASGSLLSPANSPYTVSYRSVDDDGNVANYSFTITVNQSPDPDPIIDVSGNGQFSVPACLPNASIIFTGNIYDCGISAGDNLTGQISISGAPLAVTYIQEENGFAFFEATGALAPGIYPIDVTYGGVTVQTLFNVEQDANQLPDIYMPGNLTFLLPACENQIPARFAITITDDCDPVISTNPNRLSFTYTRIGSAPVVLNWLAGSDLAQGYFEFERMLAPADNGAVITASYRDGAGNLRTVDATLQLVGQPDTWAPLIIYPSQDINVTINACDPNPAVVFFEVTVTDNCDGDHLVGPTVVPGSRFTVVVTPPNAGGVTLSSPGGDTFAGTFNPGVYQVLITAVDAAGNQRQEDFFIVVTRPPAVPTNLGCNDVINVTLDANCQRFITPDMVLEGTFGCLSQDDFLVNIVNDQNPANGNILDGAGQFIYEVSLKPGVTPVPGFISCWGYVRGEDKTKPVVDCPDDTSTGITTEEVHIISGNLSTSDPQLVLNNYSCFIDGSGTQAGNHYYELKQFQVSEDDFFTFYLDHDFATDGFVALYQGSFNPANPCENIIAQVDDNFLSVNGVGGIGLNQGPVGGPFDPVVRITLPLRAYETYYLFTSTWGANDTGDYDWVVFSDNNGWLGQWITTTTTNPATWEVTTTRTFSPFPTQQMQIALPLFCEDVPNVSVNHLPPDIPRCYRTNSQGAVIFPSNPAERQRLQRLLDLLRITGYPGDGTSTLSDNCANMTVCVSDAAPSGTGDCAPITLRRTFTVTDDSGNATTCPQVITFNRPGLGDIQMPPFTAPIECDEDFPVLANGNPAPEVTGYPFVVTVSGIFNLQDTYCNLGASFSDGPRINICAGAYKFVRTWDILDWCAPSPFIHFDQIVKVGDFTAPTVTCPGQDYDWDGDLDPLVFSTSPFSCTGAFSVPLPTVVDNCSDYEVKTEIVTTVLVDVVNQYGIVTGQRLDTVVVRLIAWNAPTRLVSGIPAGDHFFRYTVNDGCGNKVVAYCPFSVKDQIEPTAICDDNLNISIGGQNLARIHASDIDEGSNDNCGNIRVEVRRNKFNPVTYTCGTTFSNWGPYVDFFCCDVGVQITIEMRVIDEAGNINTCWLYVTPEEKVRPYCYAPHNAAIDCDDLPYSFDPTDTLQLQQLFGDATSTDNCGSYERELPPVPDLECGFGTIIRRFQAVDIHGNTSTNFCQQVVTIREVHNYEIKFPVDAEAICGVAEPDSVIYEEIGCDLLAVNHTDEVFSASGTECYKIFRKWKVVNWCQYDGIGDPLVIGRDEDCDGRPGDEAVWVLHRPGGFTYIDRDDDETEPNNVPLAFQNVCHGIDDFWRKVDYDNGFYQYTQIIKVYDNIDPQIIASPQDFCSLDDVTCTGLVDFAFRIDENCTPNDLVIKVFLDAGANGAIDANLLNLTDGLFDDFRLTGTYPNYQLKGRFPIGCHAFEVHVEDGCGNVNSELLPFCVNDCKAPSPICINGLAIELMPVDLNGDDIPDEGRMAIWASDFIVSPSPDCTGPIKYSINRTGDAPNIDSTGLMLTCADTGTLVVEIWAHDGAGNSDFCETYILVQDNRRLCVDSLVVGAAGAIATERNSAVEDVRVSLSGQSSAMMMTGSNGTYSFSSLLEGYDYTITPQRNGDYLNGVSTFDLVLISKHILGVQPLDSPYKIIAADVNNSKSITTLDLIQLRKLILSIDTQFSNNSSWRFVERSYVFPRLTNPWFEDFPEIVNINDLPATGISNADFVAVKIGDVNLDAQTNSLAGIQGRTLAGALKLEAAEREVKAGNEYTVAFTAADIAAIEGYQGTLVFDNQALELVDILPGIAAEDNFGLVYAGEGLLTMSWNQPAKSETRPSSYLGRVKTANAEMFSLVFRALPAAASAQEGQGVMLSKLLSIDSRITRAEAYHASGEHLGLELAFSGLSAEALAKAGQFELYQNTPNPFKGETLIGFNLPADAQATLAISDVTGKVLKLIRLDGVKGYNNVVVNSNDLPASGVLYYTVETAGFTATKKMVIIE